MNNYTAKDVFSRLIVYDRDYARGESCIPDTQYDMLRQAAFDQFPLHTYFHSIGSDTRANNIKLPFKMGSLNQLYDNEFEKWFAKYTVHSRNDVIAISDKLDGVSAMLSINNGVLDIGYTRGDGIEGQDITRHLKHIPNIPVYCDTKYNFTCRGELIMKNEVFDAKYASDYSTPRSLVAGLFNRNIIDVDILNDVEFIAYQVITYGMTNGITDTDTWERNIQFLNSFNFSTVYYEMINGNLINDKVLASHLKDRKHLSKYELDGIVLSFNNFNEVKSKSNSNSINPEHTVKFKIIDEDSITTTKVKKVHWKVSKNGYLKPRVEICPIKLYGTTVTFATGFNAKFILDNNIGPDSIIKVTKSGTVIPYIVEIIESTTADIPVIDIFGNYSLNESGVEFVLDDLDNTNVKFEQLLSFFMSLNVDKFKRASLGKILLNMRMFGYSYEDTINTFFGMSKLEWVDQLGVNGGKIYESLYDRLNTMTLANLLGSLKYIGVGFGKRKAKLLLDQLKDDNYVWDITYNDIIQLTGFDDITATNIIKGMPLCKKFYDDNIEYMTFPTNNKSDTLSHINVVFTGFRDKQLEELLDSMGAKVSSGISKNTTHLICADTSSTAAKINKAKKLNILIIDVDEFKDMIGI